jgi:hypothetical protein
MAVQSDGQNKASSGRSGRSGNQGAKRPIVDLKLPGWTLGPTMHKCADHASIMRPPPDSAHDNVVYGSLENTTFTVSTFLKAAHAQFDHAIVAADVFLTAKKVALAFADAEAARAAAQTGLVTGNLTTPLVYRASRAARLTKFTISNTNCTRPVRCASAIVEIFSQWGKVVDVTPRLWRDTPYHNGVWHVTIVPEGSAPPPEIVDILGRPAYVDIPGVRRICRHCKTEQHTKENCRAGRLAIRLQQESTAERLGVTVAEVDRFMADGPQLASVGTPAIVPLPQSVGPALQTRQQPGYELIDLDIPIPGSMLPYLRSLPAGAPATGPIMSTADMLARSQAIIANSSLTTPSRVVQREDVPASQSGGTVEAVTDNTASTVAAADDEVGPDDSVSQIGLAPAQVSVAPPETALAPAEVTGVDNSADGASAVSYHDTSSVTSNMATDSVIAIAEPTPAVPPTRSRLRSATGTVLGLFTSPSML